MEGETLKPVADRLLRIVKGALYASFACTVLHLLYYSLPSNPEKETSISPSMELSHFRDPIEDSWKPRRKKYLRNPEERMSKKELADEKERNETLERLRNIYKIASMIPTTPSPDSFKVVADIHRSPSPEELQFQNFPRPEVSEKSSMPRKKEFLKKAAVPASDNPFSREVMDLFHAATQFSLSSDDFQQSKTPAINRENEKKRQTVHDGAGTSTRLLKDDSSFPPAQKDSYHGSNPPEEASPRTKKNLLRREILEVFDQVFQENSNFLTDNDILLVFELREKMQSQIKERK